MKVLSYNIRYDNPLDKENQWPNRKSLVLTNIKFLGPKVIGLQECLYHQIEEIVNSTELKGRYGYIGVGRDDGIKSGEFSPILYDKNRIELIHHHHFWISENCYKEGSKSWNTACTRILTWGLFRDKKLNRTFYFLNTHLDHLSEQARSEGTILIKTFISTLDPSIHLVLVGDFNANENTKPINNLLKEIPEDQATKYLKILKIEKPSFKFQKLYNAREISVLPPLGPKRTFTGFDDAWSEVIDYIIVNGCFKVQTFVVFNNHPQKVGRDVTISSDHFPVFADLDF